MGRMNQDDSRIAEEAARWVVILCNPDSASSRLAFRAWAAQSAAHQRTFDMTKKTLKRLDGLKTLSSEAAQAWLNASDPASAKVIRFPVFAAAARVHNSSVRRRIVAGVVILAFSILGTSALLWTSGATADPLEYATNVGEQRTLRLIDGSELTLNTQSRIRVTYSANARSIELLAGEMMLDVAQDRRPLTVFSGDVLIRDIGTRFAVRRGADRTDVVVEQGVVHVTYRESKLSEGGWAHDVETKLHASQSVSIGVDALKNPPPVTTLSRSEVDRRLSWRYGQLKFAGETLKQIVGEFNRYNIDQVVIGDHSIEGIRLGGGYAANDPEGFAHALQTLGIDTSVVATSSDGRQIKLIRARK